MLTIRSEQIQQFIVKNDAELIKLIVKIMREARTVELAEYSDKTLESMVEIGIERARTHNFDRAEDIAAFVGIMFEVSPTFDEREEVKAILDNPQFSVEERFRQLWGSISEDLWIEIESKYDSKIWFPDKTK